MPQDPRAVYAQRQQYFQQAALNEERRFRQTGNVRLLLGIAAAALAWQSFVAGAISPAWVLLPVAAFLVLVVYHERIVRRRAQAQRAAAFFTRGLERLEGRWAGHGPSGEVFRPDRHLYADDLDIVGQGSLFQLICAARTAVGQQTLAKWLLAPASEEIARARQESVAELRDCLDLRENLALLGDEIAGELHATELARWSQQPPLALPGWARIAAPVLVALTFAAVLYCANRQWPLTFALPAVLLQMGFAFALRSRVLTVLADADRVAPGLKLLSLVLARFEREAFQAPALRELRARLNAGGESPARAIARLQRLLELLDSRRNAFFGLFAALLLWATQFGLALERWRQRAGAHVPEWLAAVGELEALCSLAGYAYEHPEDPFPELAATGPVFSAVGLGHPLLPEAQSVRNDVTLDDQTRLLLVSGSNMSGKSTLLRAVGTNLVLAFAGAPVRATTLRVSPLALGASLRVQDSLQHGASRFYAEISRLRDLVQLARGPLPLLFLLDELLSGTNSHDRLTGAQAVVAGLVRQGAIGLVTTHDLALTDLADTLAPRAANVHFEDQLLNGELRFDYRMRPGVVRRSNALELMRAVGLEV